MVGKIKNPIDFTIIIPAYNEENNILFTIKETKNVLEAFGHSYEILIVDDGSTDNTYGKVQEYLSENKSIVKIQIYSPNRGKGFALKYGFGFTNSRYVLFLDADLDLHPSHLLDLFKIMKDSGADVVIGSKLHKESILAYPKFRKFLSNSYYHIIRFLFRLPIKDTQTGIKLFKHEVLSNSLPSVILERYAFDLELLVAVLKKGFKIAEAPVNLKTSRTFGRVGLPDAVRVFADTLRVFWRLHVKKSYNHIQ